MRRRASSLPVIWSPRPSPGNHDHLKRDGRHVSGWRRQSATSPPPESPFRLPWLPLRPHPTLPRDQPFKGCFSSRVAPGAVLSPLTPSPHSLPGQADSGRQQPQPYSYDGQRTKWHTQVRNMVKLPTVGRAKIFGATGANVHSIFWGKT